MFGFILFLIVSVITNISILLIAFVLHVIIKECDPSGWLKISEKMKAMTERKTLMDVVLRIFIITMYYSIGIFFSDAGLYPLLIAALAFNIPTVVSAAIKEMDLLCS